MTKLYYIKCCDEQPSVMLQMILAKLSLLKKEYEQDDPAGKYKSIFSRRR